MFNSKNKTFYIFIVIILLITSVVGSKIKQRLSNNEIQDEYALIKKYLLNESPLYKDNKPKLWIHTKYEYNSRLWKSFYSRSSYDLNQPYIHLCIRTIIHHCGNDFNIILIDDNALNATQTKNGISVTYDENVTTFTPNLKELINQELMNCARF